MICCENLFLKCIVVISVTVTTVTKCYCEETKPMSPKEKIELRDEARDMFYHAYNAYMENAYPADELMPLSCAGRYRGIAPNRGDIDDSLGKYYVNQHGSIILQNPNLQSLIDFFIVYSYSVTYAHVIFTESSFSLTLIDTLDTLVILGDLEEFEHAIKLIIKDVTFDNDVVVSVFETNIRVLGGLLSAHVLADYLQQRDNIIPWYKGELLDMAKDVGYRLLPAFNTTTGIPHARVNMKYGLKSDRLESARETCTACAGSMILEMAALSRLTGEPIFEMKAHKAMDELWKMRHRSSDLMGTVLNVHSGDWVRRDSGVGAGIDSYYEYCLKAYILLGDNKYLNRFNRHYNAVMKYISQGPMLLDVHMHRPHTNSRNFMDALLAFWPGLQVLKGDIKPAVETHEMLYQVTQRHKFIPEAFTTDFQVHWGNHPLRPEFLESTYFLYLATNDPYYLEVGKNVLKSLQRYARVPCGYAAVNDVRTGKQEDRMDSFVLAETFKYLYLLFANKEDLILNLDEFIFTTEGHLLPLSLSGRSMNGTKTLDHEIDDSEFATTCPNTLSLFPESFRRPLQNMVDGICPNRSPRQRLAANDFSMTNINHLKLIKDMGINIIAMGDGRVQLLHSFSSARSPMEAEEGLIFMQEMLELSKSQSLQPDRKAQAVSVPIRDKMGEEQIITLKAGPSQFGVNLIGNQKVHARTAIVEPFHACSELVMPKKILEGKIALIERGECMFVDKVRRVQKHGAVGAIIVDNVPGSSAMSSPVFSMSGDGSDDIRIPAVFLFTQDASKLLLALSRDPTVEVTLSELRDADNFSQNEDESMFQKLKLSVQEFLNKHTGIDFTKLVKVGDFRANIGNDRIRITREGTKDYPIPKETNTNQQWSQIRKGLLKSILHTETKELYVPLNILRIYYQTLSGAPIEETKSTDVVKQTEWLLNELLKEYHNKGDDLVKPESEESVSILADIDDLLKVQKKEEEETQLQQRRENLAHLNTVIEQHLEEVYQTNEALNSIFDKIKVDAAQVKKLSKKSSDDIIVSDSSDKVDGNIKLNNKSYTNDENNNKNKIDEDIKTRINHDVDEL